MPVDELVVSDTSPILNLSLIDQLELLRQQFSTVIVPSQVWSELIAGEDGLEDVQAFRDDGGLEIVEVEESTLFVEFRRELDVGEAATLTYAIEESADLVLLDEREARRTARRHGLSMTGVVGILLKAAREERIDLQPELDALRTAGFWLSEDVYRQALERANQLPE